MAWSESASLQASRPTHRFACPGGLGVVCGRQRGLVVAKDGPLEGPAGAVLGLDVQVLVLRPRRQVAHLRSTTQCTRTGKEVRRHATVD